MAFRFLSALVVFGAAALFAAEPRPLRIVVQVDRTGSTVVNRVPPLAVADFAEIFDLILQNGGEIAVGVIRDRSNRPLLRCRVEQKPVRHAQAPPDKMNPFLRQRLMREYLAQKNEEDQAESAWKDQSQRRIDLFRAELQGLLETPLAGHTDIHGAVLRSDLFLAEPDDGWRAATRRFAVIHSDGIDNVREPAVAMRSGAAVLVVNGSASVGALAPLNPTRVESFAAAIRYIRSHSQEE